jgi:hypothetical protein
MIMAVKRPERETNHPPPSSAVVKNAWNYTSIPPIRLHGAQLKHRDNFTFYRYPADKGQHGPLKGRGFESVV